MTLEITDWDLATKVFNTPAFSTVYIYGKGGVGKTFSAMRDGLNGRNVYSLTLTPETPAAELRGFYMPKSGEFAWVDGVLIRAMREGARVVVNEVSHASHDVLALLYPILEDVTTAALTIPTGETVSPAPGFQVIMTDNFAPHQLPAALQNRFKSILEIRELHPDGLAMLSPFYRKAAERSAQVTDDSERVSLRGWLAVQEAEATLGRELAFTAVFGRGRGDALYTATLLAAA